MNIQSDKTGVVFLNIEKKRDFLINLAYWAIVAAGVYLALEYLLPISMPFLFGSLIAWLVIWLSGKLHCSHKLFRIGLSVLVYGIIGLLVTLAAAKGVSGITALIQWLPKLYENKLLPLATMVYDWFAEKIHLLDPALINALEMLLESILSGLKNLISYLSGIAVDLVSGVATGVPNLILSLLAMIFSTVFVVGDYEQIAAFAGTNTPPSGKEDSQQYPDLSDGYPLRCHPLLCADHAADLRGIEHSFLPVRH